MTDDEIDAALRPSLAIQWACDEDMVRVPNSARIAYRAGMLRAAQIARELETILWNARRSSLLNGTYPEGLSDGAGGAAAAIERAAADEPPAA